MVNTMQSEGNSECIYISDESRSVPQLSALSKSPFAASDVSSNAGVSLVDEIEMEDLSDDIIVPVTPSPLLNNKRQQHIAMERGIKRTCLEKAFSTMSTSSNNCTSGTDVMDCQFQKQEELFTENNSKSINGKENNNKFSVTSISKNNIPSKGKEILSFPRKLMSQNNVFNSSKSGILKPENNFSDAQVLEKPKVFIPRKRNTVIINSDSDDSADNMTESSYRNILHPVQSSYELRSSKEPNSDNKICQKNRTMVEHCPNKSSSEKLFENNGFMKAKKFTNKYSSTLKTDSSNRGKSHICKESNFRPIGLQYDAHLESATNRNLKSQFRITKRSPKTTCRDHYHEHEARCSATTSYNNSKSTYTMSKSQDHSNKNTDGVPNQRNNNEASMQINAIASTSSKSENGKIRRKHSHRGQISRYPVEDSDTDVEFYDAKSDLSDLADSKRPTKVGRKKKIQRRRIMECLSSDSSSDVSIVTEMRISPCNNKTPKQHLRNTESPDPVEQVRQMEEDERLAYMLQAQFDAELEGNESNEEICGDFNSSILSSLSVDSASSSSDSSSSSSFSATAAEAVFPFLVSSSLSPRILRDINGHSFGQARRSSRIQQRQQSIIGWMPESVRTVLTAWMPNFTEDNTYESLLEISEQIGEESLGLKKQQINSLPTRKFSTIHMMDSSSASGAGSRECQDCTICLCEYQNDDTLRSLPCCHEFHATCIDRWLKSHSTCPICRIEVTLRRPFGRKRKS